MTRELLNALVDLPPVAGILLKVTVVLCLGWALHFLLARANPRWRVLLWRATAIGVLLVPAIVFIMPAVELSMTQPPIPIAQQSPALNAQVPAEPTGLQPVAQTKIGSPEPGRIHAARYVVGHPWLLGSIAYALICAGFTLNLALGLRKVRRVLTDSAPADSFILEKLHEICGLVGVRRRVGLRASAVLSSPFLYGLRQPVIILPERMTQGDYVQELPGILVHELAHLQGRDLAWMNIIHLVSIALWFHPLAWRMRAAHAASCEAVCDAVAAEHVGSALNYSRTLARIALELVALPPAVGGIAMARMPEIRRRLELLKNKIQANRLAWRWVLTAVAVGLIALMMIARARIVYAETAPPEPKGDLLQFLIAQNEASKQKVDWVSYTVELTSQFQSPGRGTVNATSVGEVIKKGNSQWSVKRTKRATSGDKWDSVENLVANDQYIAYVSQTLPATAQWYDYPSDRHSPMMRRIVEAIQTNSPNRDFLDGCFGEPPYETLRQMVEKNFSSVHYDAIEAKDEAGGRVYQVRRFVPDMKDPKAPQSVWTIDPAKGFVITGMNAVHPDGTVWIKRSITLSEISSGVWFPKAYEQTDSATDPATGKSIVQRQVKTTIKDIKLNPAVSDERFQIEALGLFKLNADIRVLRTEADGAKQIYFYRDGKLVPDPSSRRVGSGVAPSGGIPAKAGTPEQRSETELTGTVTGAKSEPVAHALVYIYEELMEHYDPAKPLERRDKGTYVYTDAQGGFRIPALTPGYVFQVLVMADGFAPELVDKAISKSGPLHIILTPEPDQLKTGHAVMGKVVDQDGKPLPGVKVANLQEKRPDGQLKIYTSGRNVIYPIAITDQEGQFALRSNEADVSMWLNFQQPRMTKLEARDVKASDEVQVFKMSPGATVVGKVLDEGKPVAGAAMMLDAIYSDAQPGTWNGSSVTDKDGNFAFEHVETGREYRLWTPMSSPKPIADRSVSVAADAKRVDVGAIQTEPVSKLFKLAGKVELSDGKPIPEGAKVLLHRRVMEGLEAALGPDGRFEFKGLPADTYSITPMRIPGYVLSKKNARDPINGFAPRSGAMDPVTKKIDRDTNLTVLLEPGQATPVYAVVSADGMITAMASGNQPTMDETSTDLTGTVVSDKEEPVAGGLVYVYTAGYKNPNFKGTPEYPDIGKRVRTDGQGRFIIKSLRPDQHFGVLALADGYAHKYIYKVELPAAPLTFKLEPDAERTKPGHVVRGKVVGPDGKPLAGVVVETTAVERKMAGGMIEMQAASGDLKIDPIAITNEQGEFRITSPDTNFTVNIRIQAPGLAELAAGKLEPGESVRVFKMSPGASVVGRLLDHGKPVPDGVVDLNLISSSTPDATMVMGSQAHVKTDANGNFVFANAKPGLEYFISVRMSSIKDRGAVKGRSVRVERDGDRVDAGVFEIEPGLTLAGHVELSNKKPVPAGARVMIINATSRDGQVMSIGPDGRFEFKGLLPDVYEIGPHIQGYITSQTNAHDPLPDPLLPITFGGGVCVTKKVDRDVKDLKILVEPGKMDSYTVHAPGATPPGMKPITLTAPGR